MKDYLWDCLNLKELLMESFLLLIILLLPELEMVIKYCRLYEESYRELQTKIGESCDANPEITTETKESVAL